MSECSVAGCSARKPTISIYLSDYIDRGTERAAYYRCGVRLSNCDRYPALAYRTGNYLVFSLPQRSVFAKLGTDDRIIDVAALGEDVLVSRGTCTSSAPPPAASLRSQ